jgi:tetratricopeptide (TPR) repeat protein
MLINQQKGGAIAPLKQVAHIGCPTLKEDRMRRAPLLATALTVVISAGACTTTGIGTTTTPSDQAPMAIAVTTQSATARDEFLRGLRAQDIEKGTEARQHFDRAVAADPNFALAHLYAAFAAPSLPLYRSHLDEAIRLADRASPAEQLWIRAEQKGLDNDTEGQIVIAKQLVALTPSDPRALGYLSGLQFGAGRTSDARATAERATQVAPNFAPAFIQIGNSYLATEPADPAKGAVYIRQAVALEPNQPYTHDYLGDAYRAQNNLAAARAEYSRMIELDPSNAGAYQQRGHVNSFLGNYAEARADYDRAFALADPVNKTGLGQFRAFVHVYEGDPAAAESELERMGASIDAMNIPNAVGSKIGVYTAQATIALHNKHLDVAQRAVDRLRELFRQQADMSRSDAFRRGNEANIAYWEGELAVRRGDAAGARAKAQEIMRLRAPDQDPRKNELAHELLGMADLAEGNNASAANHFAEANPNDIYVAYHRGLALEGAGRAAEAKPFFKRVAGWNFNGPETALVKKDAARRGG